ncbi:mannitol dehydrogenase family protein [Leifsonia sp. fls2-241-R2A-40a]|uniref:mannitol dehydrogenase family protein n=1 Tax=Leifsonia sp. fls2-241-R2A-40a TaxID=3040290 RepID=UPI00254E1497|nr:mannitol dehydrogenase family protein [Leifsonia sp. fls2-241-R2A-40a]
MSAPQNLSRSRHGAVPIPETPGRSGILHLGLGNFHRAHQAVYTAAAIAADGGDWGIVGVASRSRAVVDAMRAQDHLYSVATISPQDTTLRVPAVHTDAFVAADDPQRVVAGIADPAIRIVTLTVTENGYSSSPATGRLDIADPAIAADLRGDGPRTTIGQLARGIQRRAAASGAPLTVLSCDNLAANGTHTKGLVREFLQELPTAEGAEALAFLESSVSFPSSMVDRIVPSTTPALRDEVSSLLGAWDEVPVPAEPFTMWAIEDDFAAGRPAWEAGGAVFSTEVDRYEQLKVRLLNGTHSLIAYLGALQGAETIPDAVGRPAIREAARAVLTHEYTPSIQVPSGVDIADYQRQLFLRWGNTALGHKTSQVGTDGSVKLRQRIPGPALRLLDRGEMPHLIALTVAAYLSCIAPRPGFDPGPFASAMTDGARDRLAALAGSARTGADLAEASIVDLRFFGEDLADRPAFTERVGDLVDTIAGDGVPAAIVECVTAADADVTHRGSEVVA